ncbi:MAG: DUF2807 domain-containing protein [Legionellaceae bacterium]|nr:DUF2807 domain-containing protein [Legionellaceae bacterium]
MYRNWFCIILASFWLSSCVLHKKAMQDPAKTPPQTASRHVTTIKYNVASYSRLTIEGRIDASVHSGYTQPMVILRGDPRDLRQVVTEVLDDNLLVHIGKGYPRHGPVKAEIRTRYLNYLRYEGEGTLSGSKLRSNHLELVLDNSGTTRLGGYLMLHKLTARGSGLYQISGVHSQDLRVSITENARVELTGVARLRKLQVSGNGHFNMYWSSGPSLCVRATDHAVIQLAGLIDKLDVELHQQATFEGRYLRADRAFIKTFDESIARISALKRQHSLASDQSDIYFYHLPEMRTDFMAFDGSVLDMRDWHQQALKEYSYLNKWL